MKYKINDRLRFKTVYNKDLYGARIAGITGEKSYTIEWTALKDGVEGHALGATWQTKWDEDSINISLERVYTLPEELFEI